MTLTRTKLARMTAILALVGCGSGAEARADENLFGYIRGAETLPEGSFELYQWLTVRDGKSVGDYRAYDTLTEVEYGVTDRFSLAAAFKTLSIDTKGLTIDGYLPKDNQYTLRPSGVEIEAKYNFLKPALDPIGLAALFSLDYSWRDPHSGQDKDQISGGLDFLLQKYFMEGRLVWAGNFGFEATYAKRFDIAGLPEDFDWPTDPEMEIELKGGTGLSYRFASNWYFGTELLYETEYETEVGQERWSLFAGPTLHYGSERWWATLTWLPQIVGGGETFPGQERRLHLIEKTRQEFRLKVGVNF